jgi:Flp pilus assembly protein CpaB
VDPYSGKDKVRSLTDDFSFSSVTIEVDPAQAQQIALLLANGETSTSISLRNNDDGDRQALGATTFEDLLGPDVRRIPAGRR